jgi:hypothetical protein
MFLFTGGKDAARQLQFRCAVLIAARHAHVRTAIRTLVIGSSACPCLSTTAIVRVQQRTARIAVGQGARHA